MARKLRQSYLQLLGLQTENIYLTLSLLPKGRQGDKVINLLVLEPWKKWKNITKPKLIPHTTKKKKNKKNESASVLVLILPFPLEIMEHSEYFCQVGGVGIIILRWAQITKNYIHFPSFILISTLLFGLRSCFIVLLFGFIWIL